MVKKVSKVSCLFDGAILIVLQTGTILHFVMRYHPRPHLVRFLISLKSPSEYNTIVGWSMLPNASCFDVFALVRKTGSYFEFISSFVFFFPW